MMISARFAQQLSVLRILNATVLPQLLRHKHYKTRNPIKTVRPVAIVHNEEDSDILFRDVRRDVEEFDDPDEDDPENVLERGEEFYHHHVEELRERRRKARKSAVHRKYFRTSPETNLLTWAAKQQIHYLHSLDPEEWDADKIAQCFPISVNGARKLLKTQFLTATPERIEAHDRGVSLKWKALREGSLDVNISPVTRQLFFEGKLLEDYAYGNPSLPLPQDKATIRNVQTKRQKPGEYSKLISSYMTLKNKQHNEEPPGETGDEPKNHGEYIDKHLRDLQSATTLERQGSYGKHVRLQDFRGTRYSELESRSDLDNEWAKWLQGKSASEQHRKGAMDEVEMKKGAPVDISPLSHEEGQGQSVDNIFNLYKDRMADEPVTRHSEEDLQYPNVGESVPHMHIRVPRHLKDQGETVFRVGKYYYDEDGDILYKVP